jgi:hypothetical protein
LAFLCRGLRLQFLPHAGGEAKRESGHGHRALCFSAEPRAFKVMALAEAAHLPLAQAQEMMAKAA